MGNKECTAHLGLNCDCESCSALTQDEWESQQYLNKVYTDSA